MLPDIQPVQGCRERHAILEDDALSLTTAAVQPPTALGPAMKFGPEFSSQALLERVLASLDDDKAEDVISIPLQGKSEMADFMVVCSGRSSRQVVSIAENLMERLKHDFGLITRVEGREQGDWVLIDASDVIVHVFRPEVREFYQLEKMWMTPAKGRAALA